MALIPRGLGKGEREALLLLLADAANGCTQSILMADGFAIAVLRDLVRDGLATATATRESAIAARRGIVVTRLPDHRCRAPGADQMMVALPIRVNDARGPPFGASGVPARA